MVVAKAVMLSWVLLLSCFWGSAYADYYSWKDDAGRWHLSDDIQKIPEPFRPKAKHHIEQTPPEASQEKTPAQDANTPSKDVLSQLSNAVKEKITPLSEQLSHLEQTLSEAAPAESADPPPANVLGRLRGKLAEATKKLTAPLTEWVSSRLKDNRSGSSAQKSSVRLLLPAGLLSFFLLLALVTFRRRYKRPRGSAPPEEKPKALFRAPIFGLLSTPLSTKRMAHLCRRWSSACEAGIPIINALEMVSKTSFGKERRLVHNLTERIRGGASLEEALRAEKKYLPPVVIETLAAAEQGGHLDRALQDLSRYFENLLETKRRVTSMLIYPTIQLVLAWFLGTLALRAVRLSEVVFSDPTFNFQLDEFLWEYFLFQCRVMTLVFAAIAGCWLLYRLGLLKYLGGVTLTWAWPLSRIARKFSLARFFRTLSLLIGSGMHIDRCIERAADATVHPFIARDLKRTIEPIRKGSTLSAAFAQCRSLDATAREMLHSGEKSGELEQQTEKIASVYQGEVDHALDLTLKVLGVLILLCVALFIAYLVIDIYGKLFENFQQGLRKILTG